jgi:hypothetical protein
MSGHRILIVSVASIACIAYMFTHAARSPITRAKKDAFDDLIVETKIERNRLEVKINHAFKAAYLKSDFFAEYDEDIDLGALDQSITLMPFLLNVITIVWISGRTYAIDSMDEDLFYALKTIKKVFQRMYPKTTWDGDLVPKKLVKNYAFNQKDPSYHSALLFSGGLDSTASSFYHFDKKQLLITAWGQWDVPLEKADLWAKRKKTFIAFAEKYGHSNAFIKSNFSAFLNWEVLNNVSPEFETWREDANEGLGMAGLAAPILVTKGYGELFIASSFTWDYRFPSAGNPFVDDNIRFAQNYRVKHDMFDFKRVEKLAYIADMVRQHKIAHPFLKVCNRQQFSNCCDICTKCLQTIMGLIAVGEDPHNYGFAISEQDALEKTKLFFKQKVCYWIRWNFMDIQKYIKKQIAEGKKVSPVAREFSKIQINQGQPRHKIKVDWKNFKDLAPADLAIPESDLIVVNLSKKETHK